jgi:endoglucanase
MRKLILPLIVLFCSCRKDLMPVRTLSVQNNITLDRFITDDDFRGSKMRGFNLSLVQSYPELTAKNIPAARATGANHGRLWIRIKHDASNRYTTENAYSIRAADSALKVAERVGMYIILTVEILPRQGFADYWGDATRQNNITKFWVDSLAKRYKSKKIIAAYDLMNEPRYNSTTKKGTPKECVDFQLKIIKAIRAVDSVHAIAVEVLQNQMFADANMTRFLSIPNLIYSPHGYSPLSITHQGVSTTTRKIYPALSGTYTADYFGKVTYWKYPADFARKYNVPMWVGEFSCINWAPKNSFGEWTSTRWTEDAIKYMESLGWSWSYHAWREYQGWDAEFPSSWYEGKTFTNAKPSSLPPGSARSATAPTISVLKKYFLLNLN